MNKNLDSLTKLTEFAPLSPEESSVGVGFLFSRFFKRGANQESPDTSSNVTHQPPMLAPSNLPAEGPSLKSEVSWHSKDDVSNYSLASESTTNLHPSNLTFPIYADMGDGRSLPNVLKRISNLLAMKSSGLQAYRDTDFKQYWMPDSVSKECYDCSDRFTTFRRRHHCRICGQIFCSRCCSQEIPGKIMGCTGDLRVCTYCCKVVLSYLQSADIGADLSADLRAVQEDLQSKFGESTTSITSSVHTTGTSHPQTSTLQTPEISKERGIGIARNMSRRKHSYQEDRFALGRSGNLASNNSFFASDDLHLNAEERWKALYGSSSLKALWENMKRPDTGIPLQIHRYRLRNFPACFDGRDLVDWLMENNKAATMVQAVNLGQALIDFGYMECVSHLEPVFQDGYALYRLRNMPTENKDLSSPPSSPPATTVQSDALWSKQTDELDFATTSSESALESALEESSASLPSSTSTFYLDLDVQQNRVQLRRPQQPCEQSMCSSQLKDRLHVESTDTGTKQYQELNNTGISQEFLKDTLLVEGSETRELVPAMGWHLVQNLRTDNGERKAYTRLSETFEQHKKCLLQQLLSSECLSLSWEATVMPLVNQVVDFVRPDVKNENDDMDLRQYVQFKKVSGGARSESTVISGVVCTKNVAHRDMAMKLTNPRILLLGCSIIYERVEGRFLSLEPLMMQEQDYLKNAVARITSLRPDLVLVERTVSRLAQDLLLEHGITLVLNVKSSVLERLARLTQADILTCVDAHVGRPTLGMCHNFFLRQFSVDDHGPSKTLMFFDGCATHLGCTVILRGGTSDELRRLKKVIRHMILVTYSWRLEKSFLMDEFAMPPTIPCDSFFAEEDPKDLENLERFDNSNSSCEKNSKDTPKLNSGLVKSSCDNKEIHKLHTRVGSKDKVLVATEDKKTETVVDQSDPLHQYLAGENQDVSNGKTQQLAVATLPLTNRFRKALDGTVLSSSPYLQYSVPFLETEAGRQCALRRFFPEQVFWSPQLVTNESTFTEVPNLSRNDDSKHITDKMFAKPYHPFVHARLTKCVESWEVKALLASFRAAGTRMQHPEAAAPPCTLQSQSTPVSDAPTYWPHTANTDALNPMSHQHLTVLFCSFSPESNNAPAFCVNPWVVPMELYGRNDIPLGQFLQHYCFRKTYMCPSPTCSTAMLSHIRRFVHDVYCIQVSLKKLESQIPVEGNAILMWSWCSICKLVSPVVPMSVDTWSLSFAKYLELRFHGHMFTRRGKNQLCPHSLHHDHYQYFGFQDIVTSFKVTNIALWEILLPPSVLVCNKSGASQTHTQAQAAAIEEVKHLALKGYEVFSMVLEKLCFLGSEIDITKLEGINSLKAQLNREHTNFKSKVEEIQLKLTSPTLETCMSESNCPKQNLEKMSAWATNSDEVSGQETHLENSEKEVGNRLWDIEDCLVHLKRMIAEAVSLWNARLTDIGKKKEEKVKRISDTSKQMHSNVETNEILATGTNSLNTMRADRDAVECSEDTTHFQQMSSELTESIDLPLTSQINLASNYDATQLEQCNVMIDNKKSSLSLDVPEEVQITEAPLGHERSYSEGTSVSVLEDLPVNVSRSERKSLPQVPPAATVKQIFSQLLPSNLSSNIIVSPLNGQEHHLLPASLGPAIVVHEKEPSSIIAYTLCSAEYKHKLVEARQATLFPDGLPPSPIEVKRRSQNDSVCSELQASGENSSATRRIVLSFLRGGSSPNLSANRHMSTPKAHTSATEYDGVQYTTAVTTTLEDDTTVDCITEPRVKPNNKTGGTGSSIDVHFSDSMTSFHCRVYLPEKFEALRALVFPEGEESYARSLAHSVQWEARGGKSGSSFSKTKDDRFVLKEMTQHEVQLFLDIAPNYLSYIHRALEAGQPTLLGKIMGVYRVSYRGVTGTSVQAKKINFLVMENLFYGRTITQRFDLKGSIRNRLAETTVLSQNGDIVLLDENLLKMTCDSPLYIYPHSKMVLTLAIEKDTQFLSSQAVMDYSLLVGLDEERRELVLGIIDYIRTFTWDKRLETMVKSSGILGGQGKLPTIVSPELYQSRFMAAMHRYFLPVPDRWTGLGSGVDC